MWTAQVLRWCLAVGISTVVLFQANPGMDGWHQQIEAGGVPLIAEDSRKLKISHTIRQNLDNSYRLFVPDKCELEGEYDLRKMAFANEQEESYIFLPSKCLWIEIGSNETATSVRSDSSIVQALVSSYESVTIYHTHVSAETDSSGGFPAYGDLLGAILIGGDVPLIDGQPMIHRAVTRKGIFEYSLKMTPEIIRLVEKLDNLGLSGFISQNLAYLFSDAKYEKKYYDEIVSCTQKVTGTGSFDSDCFPMSANPFSIKFHEVEKIVGQRDAYLSAGSE